MLQNYVITAFRYLNKTRLVSALNITGLSVSLSVVIFIFLQTRHELSYDSFHTNKDHLYRVEETQTYNHQPYHVNVTPWPSGPVWQEEIPEIKLACRYISAGNLLLRYKDIGFYERKIYAADSSFFNMFSFNLLQGHPDQVLKKANSIVLSEELAKKYFNNINPVGKIITINNEKSFEVTGIFKKPPDHSSLQFDALVSFEYMKSKPWYSENWGNNSIFTYLLLQNDVKVGDVNLKLTQIVDLHYEQNTTKFMVAPMKKMHLYSYFGFTNNHRGIETLRIFIAIAIFILIIACINFTNLSTAGYAVRTKEISMRKINGAHRKNLIFQFLGESIMVSVIATLIALIIVFLLLPQFNQITGKNFLPSSLNKPGFIVGLVIITLFTGIVSGIYPSLVLSSINPLTLLRSSFFRSTGGGWFRKISVVLQFTLGIILIISTLVVYQQLRFMQDKELGYDKNNLLYIYLQSDLKGSYPVLKDKLEKLPEIESITSSYNPPHKISSNSGSFDYAGKDPDKDILVSFGGVGYDYIQTMKIRMTAGRSFSREYSTDRIRDTLGSFMINEELQRVMNIENIIGKEIRFNGITGPIIGIMEDYHYEPARNIIEPLALIVAPAQYISYMFIRISPGNIPEKLKRIENKWNELMPLYPFDYKFVDQDFETMYRFEERMGKLLKAFTFIAIIVACIGLFGLSAFSAELRTKETGIRKTFGADITDILKLFSKEIILLLIISAFIAWPISWYLLKIWLSSFDYRINLNPLLFIGSGLLTFIIAGASISYQVLKVAVRNPAESLRYE